MCEHYDNYFPEEKNLDKPYFKKIDNPSNLGFVIPQISREEFEILKKELEELKQKLNNLISNGLDEIKY